MMDESTESTIYADFVRTAPTISKMTDVQDRRVTAYHLAHWKTLDDVLEAELDRSKQGKQRKSGANTPANRHLLNHLLKKACENAALMEEAARKNEPLDLGLAGMELMGNLRGMWDLRSLRSDEWTMVLNFLQTALAGEVLEGFDAAKSHAIHEVVEKHLSLAADQEDVDSCIELLEGVGLDPLKVMAAYRE
jgi:hypothetical protein